MESPMKAYQAVRRLINRLVRADEGVTAIEYGLIASLIAIGIAASATSIGTQLVAIFGSIATKLGAAG